MILLFIVATSTCFENDFSMTAFIPPNLIESQTHNILDISTNINPGNYCVVNSENPRCPYCFDNLVRFEDVDNYNFAPDKQNKVQIYIADSTPDSHPVFNLSKFANKMVSFHVMTSQDPPHYLTINVTNPVHVVQLTFFNQNAKIVTSNESIIPKIDLISQIGGNVTFVNKIVIDYIVTYVDYKGYYDITPHLSKYIQGSRHELYINFANQLEYSTLTPFEFVLNVKGKAPLSVPTTKYSLYSFQIDSPNKPNTVLPIFFGGFTGCKFPILPVFHFRQSNLNQPIIMFDGDWEYKKPKLSNVNNKGAIIYENYAPSIGLLYSQSQFYPNQLFGIQNFQFQETKNIGWYLVNPSLSIASNLGFYINVYHQQLSTFTFQAAPDQNIHIFVGQNVENTAPVFDSSIFSQKQFSFHSSEGSNPFLMINCTDSQVFANSLTINNYHVHLLRDTPTSFNFSIDSFNIYDSYFHSEQGVIQLDVKLNLGCSLLSFLELQKILIPSSTRRIQIGTGTKMNSLKVYNEFTYIDASSPISINGVYSPFIELLCESSRIGIYYEGNSGMNVSYVPSITFKNPHETPIVFYADSWKKAGQLKNDSFPGTISTYSSSIVISSEYNTYPSSVFLIKGDSSFVSNKGRYCVSLGSFENCPKDGYGYNKVLATPGITLDYLFESEKEDSSILILIMDTTSSNQVFLETSSFKQKRIILKSPDKNQLQYVNMVFSDDSIEEFSADGVNISLNHNDQTLEVFNFHLIDSVFTICNSASFSLLETQKMEITNSTVSILINGFSISSNELYIDLSGFDLMKRYFSTIQNLVIVCADTDVFISIGSSILSVSSLENQKSDFIVADYSNIRIMSTNINPELSLETVNLSDLHQVPSIVFTQSKRPRLFFDDSWVNISSTQQLSPGHIASELIGSTIIIITMRSDLFPNQWYLIDSKHSIILQNPNMLCLYTTTKTQCLEREKPIYYHSNALIDYGFSNETVSISVYDSTSTVFPHLNLSYLEFSRISVKGKNQYLNINQNKVYLYSMDITGVNLSINSANMSSLYVSEDSLFLPHESFQISSITTSLLPLDNFYTYIDNKCLPKLIIIGKAEDLLEKLIICNNYSKVYSKKLSYVVNHLRFDSIAINLEKYTSNSPFIISMERDIQIPFEVKRVPDFNLIGDSDIYIHFTKDFDGKSFIYDKKSTISNSGKGKRVFVSEYETIPSSLFNAGFKYEKDFNYTGFYCFFHDSSQKCPEGYQSLSVLGYQVFTKLPSKYNSDYHFHVCDTDLDHHPVFDDFLSESNHVYIGGNGWAQINDTHNIPYISIKGITIVLNQISINVNHLKVENTSISNTSSAILNVSVFESDFSSFLVFKNHMTNKFPKLVLSPETQISTLVIRNSCYSFVLWDHNQEHINIDKILFEQISISINHELTYGLTILLDADTLSQLPDIQLESNIYSPCIFLDGKWDSKTQPIDDKRIHISIQKHHKLIIQTNQHCFPEDCFIIPTDTSIINGSAGQYCISTGFFLNQCPIRFVRVGYDSEKILDYEFQQHPENNQLIIKILKSTIDNYPTISLKSLRNKFVDISASQIGFSSFKGNDSLQGLTLSNINVINSQIINSNVISIQDNCVFINSSLNPIDYASIAFSSLNSLNSFADMDGTSFNRSICVFGKFCYVLVLEGGVQVSLSIINPSIYVSLKATKYLNIVSESNIIEVDFNGTKHGNITLVPSIQLPHNATLLFSYGWEDFSPVLLGNKGSIQCDNFTLVSVYTTWPNDFFDAFTNNTILSNGGFYCIHTGSPDLCPKNYRNILCNNEIIDSMIYPHHDNKTINIVLNNKQCTPIISGALLTKAKSVRFNSLSNGNENGNVHVYVEENLSMELFEMFDVNLTLTGNRPEILKLFEIGEIVTSNTITKSNNNSFFFPATAYSTLLSASSLCSCVYPAYDSSLMVYSTEKLSSIILKEKEFIMIVDDQETSMLYDAFFETRIFYTSNSINDELIIEYEGGRNTLPEIFAYGSMSNIFFDSSCYESQSPTRQMLLIADNITKVRLRSEFRSLPPLCATPGEWIKVEYDFGTIPTMTVPEATSTPNSKEKSVPYSIIFVSITLVIGLLVGFFLLIRKRSGNGPDLSGKLIENGKTMIPI